MAHRAVVYVRISKDRRNETSTATQEQECRALCIKRGWEVVKVECDQGRSAFKNGTKRPAFDRALKLIDRRTADVIVVWKLDRLHRGIVDFWATWQRINAAGGQLVSVTDDLDTTRTAGKIMVGLIAGFAEMESEVKSDRATAWHAGRRARALPPTGQTLFGYRRVDDGLEIVEEYAEAIRAAAKDVIEGGRTLRSIVREWNERGLRSARWTHYGVKIVLTSLTLSARREIEGVLVEGAWPAILDVETADRVRAILLDPHRRVSPTNQRRWMLSGIASCECGGPVLSRSHQKGTRYACRRCGKSIGAKVLDAYVTEALFTVVTPKVWAARQRAGTPGVDVDALAEEIAELARMYADNEIDLATFKVMKAGAERKVAEAKLEPVELPALDDLRAGWESLPADDRALVVTAFCNSITLSPGRGDVTERVKIDWTV